MPKKRRSRARHRAFAQQSAPAAPAAPREEVAGSAPAPVRPRFTRPGTISRATGQPSQTLMRAATAEYAFVVRDIRRIAVTAAASGILLVIAAFAANVLFNPK